VVTREWNKITTGLPPGPRMLAGMNALRTLVRSLPIAVGTAALVLATSAGCHADTGGSRYASPSPTWDLCKLAHCHGMIRIQDLICRTNGCGGRIVNIPDDFRFVLTYQLRDITLSRGTDPFTTLEGRVSVAPGATSATLDIPADPARLAAASGTFTVVLYADGHPVTDTVGNIP
jgi:hypothetical protein